MAIPKKITILALLALLVVISYYPSLFNQFTNWDDDKFLTANSYVQNLSWDNLQRIWTTHFEDGYQPLTMFSFAIEHYFFKLDPFFYHLDNLLLHIVNVWLVFLIVLMLTQRPAVAFITALLFAVHPMRVEPIAWVSARKDLLFSFFYLLSMRAYVKKQALMCFMLFILSCLAKHQAVSLPFVLLLIDGVWDGKNIFKKIPFFLVSVGILLVTITRASLHWTNIDVYSWLDKFFLVSYAVIVYLIKMVIPYQICNVYVYPDKSHGVFPWYVQIAPLIILLALYLIYKFRRDYPWVIAGSLFFVFTIALPLTSILYGGMFIYDRYTYLPCIGIFLIVAYILSEKKRLAYVILAVYLVPIFWLTHERCKVWHDGVTLWSAAIKQYPNNFFVYCNRGTAYALNGRDDLALNDFNKAVALNPKYASSLNNRAHIYLKSGKEEEALNDYNKAISENPKYGLGYFNRSILYYRHGQNQQAMDDLLKAKALGIQVPEPYFHSLKVTLP